MSETVIRKYIKELKNLYVLLSLKYGLEKIKIPTRSQFKRMWWTKYWQNREQLYSYLEYILSTFCRYADLQVIHIDLETKCVKFMYNGPKLGFKVLDECIFDAPFNEVIKFFQSTEPKSWRYFIYDNFVLKFYEHG